ncbi:hypothetical protein TTHERM_00600640 (macronuclear) [Tetrahymena thermophila SB210]|uniref:Uncharacterized protein n=1 Tax=Tetrahymena thermophila (strain SB210) TaxID=312017 RepID=I7MCT0_TETTS|nr:hypothetical protein TTHERM_00600640 [Tetrahymena thermophila SB210]EAR84872.2 hypothetical protein TTHERM_00600640 [Tetrahymena thermophila SB210]|eukprot:XP_001032535.2 hypothetical protein TTHERM_00600640 [Tetrahymena thermophila SB210]
MKDFYKQLIFIFLPLYVIDSHAFLRIPVTLPAVFKQVVTKYAKIIESIFTLPKRIHKKQKSIIFEEKNLSLLQLLGWQIYLQGKNEIAKPYPRQAKLSINQQFKIVSYSSSLEMPSQHLVLQEKQIKKQINQLKNKNKKYQIIKK